MNIDQSKKLRPLVMMSLITVSYFVMAPIGKANAGFQLTVTSSEQAAPTIMPTTKVTSDQDYNVAHGIDENAPALKIYDERYIPDFLKQPQNIEKQQSVDFLTPIPDQPQQIIPTNILPNTVDLSTKKETVKSWRARKGENVRDILRRWSQREDVDLMWASPDTPDLQKEFSYVGNFQDAVSKLFDQNGLENLHSQFRTEGLAPVMMEPASTITTNVPVPEVEKSEEPETSIISKTKTIFAPGKSKLSGPETKWFALSGAPLAEVLNVWAEDAGATLIWQADKNYALKESISRVGKFEDAVYQALSQYDDETIRPVGELYAAQNGGKVLVIKTDTSN